MKKIILIAAIGSLPLFSVAQLTIEQGAEVYLARGAEFSVQGDLDLHNAVFGHGVLTLNGNGLQLLDAHNNHLPQLFIHNRYGIQLLSPLKLVESLLLHSGNLLLGDHDLELGNEAVVSGNSSAYIVTNGRGLVSKYIEKDINEFILPIGTLARYAPLTLSSEGTYRNGKLTAAARSQIHPVKPVSSRDYLEEYWTVKRAGVTGEVFVKAFYNGVTGDEQNLLPHYWNGREWLLKTKPVDVANKTFVFDVPDGDGDIYAMHSDRSALSRYGIAVQPNPVHATATILLHTNEDENTLIRIIDNLGTTVMTKTATLKRGGNQLSIDVSTLASAQYIITATGSTTRSVMMIKQ
jgi:hypothetical protein